MVLKKHSFYRDLNLYMKVFRWYFLDENVDSALDLLSPKKVFEF